MGRLKPAPRSPRLPGTALPRGVHFQIAHLLTLHCIDT